MLHIIIQIIILLPTIFLAYAVLQSYREAEFRAARIFATGFFFFILIFFYGIYFDGFPVHWILAGLILVSGVVLFVPIRAKTQSSEFTKLKPVDERTIMFSRNALQPGSERFEQFYKQFPQYKKRDDEFRKNPGLLSKNASLYHEAAFAAAKANFSVVDLFRQISEKPPHTPALKNINPDKLTLFLTNWARKLGACDSGTTLLKPYHLYSHIGRWEKYGDPVNVSHPFAFAFLVAMDKRMIDPAPKGSVILESSEKYLKTGQIAIQIAEYLRELGYDARAHIDADYRVICPLVARDAGLGEIGRMGLLMSHKNGPSVRIAVVTTNAPLLPGKAKTQAAMIDFCEQCNKCSYNCPAKAIPKGPRTEIDGVLRWQIDSDSCFRLWTASGTDCGRCLKVCPFSHPDNLLHNFIRWGIANNVIFSRLALKADNWFYGKYPYSKKLPEWMNIMN